jgi:hypothetical protein
LISLSPGQSLTALARTADPFGDHPWPPDTNLSVTAPEWLARGEAFVLRGELHGVVPDRAELVLATEGASTQSIFLPVIADESAGTFGVRIEPNRVPRTFRYQVRANDAATSWRTVPVYVPPELADRDGRPSPQVHLAFPKYTGQAAIDLPDGGFSVDGVTGTTVQIRAAVDRPIVRAWMALSADSPIRAIASLSAIGAQHPADATAQAANGLAVTIPAMALVSEDGLQFDLTIIPPVSGRYELKFEDASGLAGRREFEMRMAADPSPTVHLDRPAASRDSLSVLPEATVALAARIEDPVFAVRSAWLEYRVNSESAWRRISLTEPLPNRLPSLGIEKTWDLKSVRHTDGRPLQDGDVVTIAVAADDFDDVTTTKPPGRSHQVELRIVSPAGLRGIVQKSEAEIQRELAALHGMQRTAQEKTAAANEQRRQSGTLSPADLNRLAEAAQMQQQIRQRIGNEREGLRSSVEQLRQTLRSNPLTDAAAERERADSLAAELDRLQREEIDPVEPLLAAARTEQGPVAPESRSAGPLPQANRFQRDAERSLRDLSERMREWSDARELRAEAALLERDQERLMRQREEIENQPGVRGTDLHRLPADQRLALNRLAERQSALADRANELTQKLNQRTAEKQAAQQAKQSEAGSQPSGAEAQDSAELLAKQEQALAKARDRAQESPSLSTKLNEAAQSLGANRLGEAQSAQSAATEKLRQIQDALAESPEKDVDRLAKRLAEAQQEIDRLLDDQERLQKRAAEIESMTEPAAKKQAQEQLAREQEALRQRTDDLAQRLSRLRQDSAAQDLRRATRSMDQARDAIEQGQPAEHNQDQALDRLEDSQMRVEQENQRLKDELQREQMTRIIDALKGFLSRQEALNAESERLFQSARAEQSWSRALQKSLIDLGQSEQSLSGEVQRFSDEKLKDARVVAHLLRDCIEAMSGVAPSIESIRNGPMDAASWEADRRRVQSPQQLASRRLKQLLDTLHESEKEQREQHAQTPQNHQPGEGGSGAPGDGIPSIVQLKLLRALQAELNEQTNAFAKEHPDAEKWTDAERSAIRRLEKSQADLAALIESVSATDPPKEDKK